jgi:hypothetical protein
MPRPLAIIDSEEVRRAGEYVEQLSDADKPIIQTWLVAEAVLAGLYYVLLFAVVFFLGRRIIQAVIAAYREARAESV